MRHRLGSYASFWILAICLLAGAERLSAQQRVPPGAPTTLPNAPQRDTNSSKTNTTDWHTGTVSISSRQLHSDALYVPDSVIHTFHRRPFSQPWYRNLGNHGGPVRNLFFTPEYRVGPTLGYHAFDVYRYDIDSLFYYNTTRPYSVFTFQLGSKKEQTAEIMHTQNIKANWNFSFQYRKLTSPGYYKIQRTNHDNANFTTNYQSRNQRYELFAAFVYNKEQNDENGGILHDSLLTDPAHEQRQTIPVRFEREGFGTQTSIPRSPVSNTLRDFSVMVQHRYTFGRIDTVYNEDSTHFRTQLTPRFSVKHRMQVSSWKYTFVDRSPDSARYEHIFPSHLRTTDSVKLAQRWITMDNRLLLGGFLGKKERQFNINAGIGIRFDHFTNEFSRGNVKNKITSNYVIAEARKEALYEKQWFYNANALVYLTGETAGSSLLQAELGKDLGRRFGNTLAGFKQEINNPPYSYTIYMHDFDTMQFSLNKESVTQLYATVQNDRLRLYGGVRNYLISNYIYLDEKQLPAQYAPAFNITQVWLQKIFRWRSVVLDNELAYQQQTAGAPVNIPALLGRHQLSLETYVFGDALQIATGIEMRYHSPYKPAGYAPLFARFHYQNSYLLSNDPEYSAFFNFRIKRFRAYLMVDQLQQLFTQANLITAPGYPAQNFMIRFGFNWVMIN